MRSTPGMLFPRLHDGSLYRTLVDMIKDTIPELQKLSTADKFALAVELWDAELANSELDLVVGYLPKPPKELIRCGWHRG
jgi:hypothetical protein